MNFDAKFVNLKGPCGAKRANSLEEKMAHSRGEGFELNDTGLIKLRKPDDIEIFELSESESDDAAITVVNSVDLFPEVQLTSSTSTTLESGKQKKRQRKQNLQHLPVNSGDELAWASLIEEIVDGERNDDRNIPTDKDDLDLSWYTEKRRRRSKIPLYLLNPADFSDHPEVSRQIRRAFVTYRHHQQKKEQIIKLTLENRALREFTDVLKDKIREMGSCECRKGGRINLEDILNYEVPEVPPRFLNSGHNGFTMDVPYNDFPINASGIITNSSPLHSTNDSSISMLQNHVPAPTQVIRPSSPVPVKKPQFWSRSPEIKKDSTKTGNEFQRPQNDSNQKVFYSRISNPTPNCNENAISEPLAFKIKSALPNSTSVPRKRQGIKISKPISQVPKKTASQIFLSQCGSGSAPPKTFKKLCENHVAQEKSAFEILYPKRANQMNQFSVTLVEKPEPIIKSPFEARKDIKANLAAVKRKVPFEFDVARRIKPMKMSNKLDSQEYLQPIPLKKQQQQIDFSKYANVVFEEII